MLILLHTEPSERFVLLLFVCTFLLNTHKILFCVKPVLSTTADCITCVCDVLGILGGADSSACDPSKMLEEIRTKKEQLKFMKNL